MAIEHDAISDDELHEPKGAIDATSGQIYIADGAGSGTWTTLVNPNRVYLTQKFEDLGTSGSSWLVCPVAGLVTSIAFVIDAGITTSDTDITVSIGTTSMGDGEYTIGFGGSAAVDIHTITPTGLNTIAAGELLQFNSDGATDATSNAYITYTLDIS